MSSVTGGCQEGADPHIPYFESMKTNAHVAKTQSRFALVFLDIKNEVKNMKQCISIYRSGVGIFCGSLYRGVNLTLRVLQDVFKLEEGLGW